MSYAFPRHVERIDEAVRQIAAEQIDKAIAEIDDAGLAAHETVHQVRKRCKKLRALARLVRPGFPSYKKENAFFRDLARGLSGARDAQVMCEAYHRLVGESAEPADGDRFAAIVAELERRRDAAIAGLDEEQLKAAREVLVEARVRIAGWSLRADGFGAVRPSLKATYERCRQALGAVDKKPTAARLHELRKRAKYCWYHLRLLTHHMPAAFENRVAATSALGDLLGDDHDLAVLSAQLEADRGAFGGKKPIKAFQKLIDAQRAMLQEEALGLAHSLFDDKPKAFADAFAQSWSASPEPPAEAPTGPVSRFPTPAIIGA